MAAKKQTFEAAGAELDAILAKLELESTSLEDALKLYARAAELMRFCEETLRQAQVRVDEIQATMPETIRQEAETEE